MTRKLSSNKNVLVTGGAGFIGSHFVESLTMDKSSIRVLDDLSSGNLDNITSLLADPKFKFIKADLLNSEDAKDAVRGCEIICHFAANPEVRVGSTTPSVHFRQNVEATYNLLEAAMKLADVEKFVFTSSSTVYGEALRKPTPEDYAPMEPISVYGASKLACEALITAYAHTYGFNAVIYRLANIVGGRNRQGVVHDFVQKLVKDPNKLLILGDGSQTKSYLHISDCISALLVGMEKAKRRVEVFNVGSEDQIDVRTIAEIIVQEMKLKDVKFTFTGGVDGGRGWKGDVKNMLLDVSRLKSLGWMLRFNSIESIRLAARQILALSRTEKT